MTLPHANSRAEFLITQKPLFRYPTYRFPCERQSATGLDGGAPKSCADGRVLSTPQLSHGGESQTAHVRFTPKSGHRTKYKVPGI